MLWRILMAAAILGGCSFDQSGLDRGDSGANADDGGGVDGDPNADAGPCPAPLHVVLRVEGQSEPLGTAQPYAHVLVGDTVTLSAAGSCAQSGPVSYQWQVSPIDDTRLTAEPSLAAETLTVYPVAAQPYNVSLTVSAAGVESRQIQVFGFEAHAWRSLDGLPQNEVRDLSAGDDVLWIAAKAGAYQVSLQTPFNGFFAVNDSSVGETIPNELLTVFHDVEDDMVWFGQTNARSTVWRLDRNKGPAEVQVATISNLTALGAPAEVYDIGRLDPGIALATSLGATWSLDNDGFEGKFAPVPASLHAMARGGSRQWLGGFGLYDMNAGGAVVNPRGGPITSDLKIRALDLDPAGTVLWVGTEDAGVIRYDQAANTTLNEYSVSTPGLDSSKVRALVVEKTGAHAGDVWIATDKGVARFKRDRGVWMTMGNSLGLTGKLDVRALAVDEDGGRRVIWAGTSKGLVYLRAP